MKFYIEILFEMIMHNKNIENCIPLYHIARKM